MLFEKVQHTGDCGLTGRFADNGTDWHYTGTEAYAKNASCCNYCVLFGSYAKGKAKETSDVDLLISADIKGLKFYGMVENLKNDDYYLNKIRTDRITGVNVNTH